MCVGCLCSDSCGHERGQRIADAGYIHPYEPMWFVAEYEEGAIRRQEPFSDTANKQSGGSSRSRSESMGDNDSGIEPISKLPRAAAPSLVAKL